MATPIAPDPERPLLEVSGLSTTYHLHRGSLRAVDDVSFSVDVGKTIGIVGESGSGKSVLVRSVMDLLGRNAEISPTARVVFDGVDMRTLSPHQRQRYWGREIAMIFQDPMTSLNPVRRIGQQITDPLRKHLGMKAKEAEARAIDLLRLVGIPDPTRRLQEYPHQLSGGMRQRVTIAIAISCEPKLLVADEPTTALDVTVQRQILELLADLQERLGMAMILITHDLGVVASYADDIAVMYAGRLVEQAPTDQLFFNTHHPYTEALLRSIPRVEQPSHTLLHTIDGRPPNLLHPPVGCRFAARCDHRADRCAEEPAPLLRPVDPDGASPHRFACHFRPDERTPADAVSTPVANVPDHGGIR